MYHNDEQLIFCDNDTVSRVARKTDRENFDKIGKMVSERSYIVFYTRESTEDLVGKAKRGTTESQLGIPLQLQYYICTLIPRFSAQQRLSKPPTTVRRVADVTAPIRHQPAHAESGNVANIGYVEQSFSNNSDDLLYLQLSATSTTTEQFAMALR